MAKQSLILPDSIELPVLHPGQVEAYMMPSRFTAIRCGRRWGKTDLFKTVGCDGAIKGLSIGWFTPDYKIQSEAFNEIKETLYPIIAESNKVDGVIRTKTRGRIDFWTLNNKRAGRSRKYHIVLLDEIAFATDDMEDIWRKSIRPTLLDYGGYAMAGSTPNGDDPDNFFWQICNNAEHGFKEYHAPSHSNPYLPREEIEKLEKENHPMVFRQEYLAEFVDWSGAAFFQLSYFLVDDKPIEPDLYPDAIFAVIDTAVKGNQEHDGTAITYYSYRRQAEYPLQVLDWDIVQIEGSLLEVWMPSVYERLDQLNNALRAAYGVVGAFIEDKAAGSILIKQLERKGMKVFAVDSKLTAAGKDERCISVSGYAHTGKIKLTTHAYTKVVTYKGIKRNHWIGQVCGYHVGVKDQQDDLLDTFTYGASITLGNKQGF